MGRGIKMLAELYGGMILNGVEYVYNYDTEDLVEKSKFTKEQREKSERKKFERIKSEMDKGENCF